MIDWNAVKTEYISQNVSYRQLAKKYHIGLRTIERRGGDEGWVAQRRESEDQAREKILGDVEGEVKRAKRLQRVADKLLDRVEQALDDPGQKTGGDLKNLAGTLKNIKEIQMIRSSLDEREQLAKIAALEKKLEEAGADKTVSVELDGQLELWSE